MTINFEDLSRYLQIRIRDILTKELPGGKAHGREYTCGSIDGGAGGSFSVNLETGVWKEFGQGQGTEGGGDVISLVACKYGLSQLEAARRLATEWGYEPSPGASHSPGARPNGGNGHSHHPPVPAVVTVRAAPPEQPTPNCYHPGLGKPVGVWAYRDAQGAVLFCVARYETPKGKEFRPWSYSYATQKWVCQGVAVPRPLYGLQDLAANPTLPVLIVEGEKAADAAGRIAAGRYVAVTWANGANAVATADWTPLSGRKLLLLPDNDEAGRAAMDAVATLLFPHCPEIKLLNPAGMPDGWDIADSDFTWGAFYEWAKPRASLVAAPPTAPPPVAPTPQAADPVKAAYLQALAQHSEHLITTQFSQKYDGKLRYTEARGWLKWDGMRWRPTAHTEVMELARKHCSDYVSDPSITGATKGLIRSIASTKTAGNVERLSRGSNEFWHDFCRMDENLWAFNTPGGTVDLRSGEVRPHNQSDNITKIANAKPHGQSALWLDFLNRATGGDLDLIKYLQRIAGYALCGDPAEECLLFFYGTGGNGKGTFLNTIQYAMGDYATTASTDTFTEAKNDRHPTDLAKLAGSRLVVAQEVEEGKYWNESRLKSMTGRDIITARFMSKDFFDYMPQFTIMVSGNNKPSFKTVDDSIRRRLHLIPFNMVIPKDQRDIAIKEKLRAQIDGVMAWMVEGCLEWQRVGLNPPQCVLEATEEYLEDEDTLNQWVKECCETGRTFSETTAQLYASFKGWKEVRGEGVLSHKKFTTNLVKLGFKRNRTEFARLINGIRLTESSRNNIQHQPHFSGW